MNEELLATYNEEQVYQYKFGYNAAIEGERAGVAVPTWPELKADTPASNYDDTVEDWEAEGWSHEDEAVFQAYLQGYNEGVRDERAGTAVLDWSWDE